MSTIYVSGLQRFSRARLKVPSPSTTLKQLMEVFCKEQKLSNPEFYLFYATKGSKKAYDMSLPFRLSNIHNGDAVDIKRNPAVRAPEAPVPAPATASETPAVPQSQASSVHVMSDAERMQQLAILQEQERLAAERIEMENRLAAQRAREEQDRRMREEEAKRKQDEEIAQRLREKEAKMMKQWNMDDDSLMAQVAQQMSSELQSNSSTKMTDEPRSATVPEPQPPEKPFDINMVSVYKPSEGGATQNVVGEDLPDDFYELTVDDLRAIRESEKQSKESSGVLMTREMRERERQKKWAAFTTCSVRVRFPDRVELMNVFAASSRVSDLYNFVRQCMTDQEAAFELYTTPPLTVLSNMNASFIDSHLVPAAIVHLRWTGAKKPSTHEVLRPDLLEKIQNGVPQASSTTTSSSTPSQTTTSSSAKLVCSVCLSSNLKLFHCMECDNNYCNACWNTIHDPSENPELGRHHKGEVRAPSAIPPSTSEPDRQHPRMNAGGDRVASSKSDMPKWFRLGKKY